MSIEQIPISKPFLHFGYLRSEWRMRQKMQIYEERSLRGDFPAGFMAEEWFNDVWYDHRKCPQVVNVHPLAYFNPAYMSRVQPYREGFPQVLWQHPYIYVKGLVSIVTVTHNSANVIRELLASFAAFDPGVPCEWFIIDSGSKEPYLAETIKYGGQRIRSTPLIVKVLGANAFFTQSLNIGMTMGRGEYFLSLNPDVRITRAGWLKRMVEDMKEVSAGGIVGCKQLYHTGRIQHAGGFYDKVGEPYHRGCDVHAKRGEKDEGQYDTVEAVPWVTGSCMLISRRVFVALGFLDQSSYPHYGSDRVYCEEARRNGFEIVYSPTSVMHLHGRSSEEE